MRDRSIYRVHVWRDWVFNPAPWLFGVWKDGGGVKFPTEGVPLGYKTQPEALAAGLKWAGELNAREAAER